MPMLPQTNQPVPEFNLIFLKQACISGEFTHVEFDTDKNVIRRRADGETLSGAFYVHPDDFVFRRYPEAVTRGFNLYVFHACEGSPCRFVYSENRVTVYVSGRAIFSEVCE